MARIRTIKPEFWTDEDIAMLSEPARLLAIGLLNHADDEGYFKAHPMLVKAAVFPLNEPSVSVQELLNELSNANYIMLANGIDGKQYGKVRSFTTHQRVNRPNDSKIKELVSFNESSMNAQGKLNDASVTEQGTGNREQGTGKGVMAQNEAPKKRKRFTPPNLQEVSEYFFERCGDSSEAQNFVDFYESKGWYVGKNKMKDWKASVRNWISRNEKRPAPKQQDTDQYYQELANTRFE